MPLQPPGRMVTKTQMVEQRRHTPIRGRRRSIARIALAMVAPVLAQAAERPPPAAAVEANYARRADLERLPGIGVDLADAMLRERERRPFEDWADLIARVPGLGPRRAAHLSLAGLRVQGLTYGSPAATTD